MARRRARVRPHLPGLLGSARHLRDHIQAGGTEHRCKGGQQARMCVVALGEQIAAPDIEEESGK